MTHIAETPSRGVISSHAESGDFLRGFVGSAVLLLAMDAIEPMFFGPGYFAGLTYHPFWIVILLAAVQHGLFVGLSVVGLAALLMDWPPRPLGVDITAHYADVATVPAQWLLVALVIGLYRQQQRRHERSVPLSNDRLRQVNETLADEIRRLDAYVAQSERMVAIAGSAPNSAMLTALDALARADAAQRRDAFVAAARLCLPGPGAWLALDNGGLVTAASTQPGISLPALEVGDIARDGEWRSWPADPSAFGAAVMLDDALLGVITVQAPLAEAAGYEAAMDALRRALQDSLRSESRRPVLRLERPNLLLSYANG
ncbi:MAG: hypothetical protein LPJ95_01285 [Paracoccaceae bacterium]|nr:hypothetical protein [Paracoccaceae bacterium]